ncbi:Forkhead box protein I2 [Frankliniella fusca]|uniref:Forkhead box protein I2 n=1 Tax=Frankliniella fusca TaxID=407009 RepID=A0AAE1H7P0_9NEOP|nr:Forkhead box protein I2 [Frankliniella fusca]
MCSNETSSPSGVGPTAILPYPLSALKTLQDAAGNGGGTGGGGGGGGGTGGGSPLPPPGMLPIDQYRLQLYNYAMAERLQRFGPAGPFSPVQVPGVPLCPGLGQGLAAGYPYGPRLALSMSLFHQRMLQPEEPKPQHSYIGLIAMAILSSPDAKLVLSDIYQYILDNYPYFRTRGPGWRNSIRHNLSLNDCFIKAGRSANGKGHYWAIHPANVDDFKKGDFRRRKAQRKDRHRGHFEGSGSTLDDVRKHMGLAVDEEGNESPSPPPTPASPPLPPTIWAAHQHPRLHAAAPLGVATPIPCLARKRQFDVASLLAPDDVADVVLAAKTPRYASSGEEDAHDEDIDVVSSDAADAQQATTPPMTPVGSAPPTPTPWPPQSPNGPGPLFMTTVEHHLVSRYYEQLQHSAVRRLALQQQQQQQMRQQQVSQQTTEIRELTPSPRGGSPPGPVAREPTPQ